MFEPDEISVELGFALLRADKLRQVIREGVAEGLRTALPQIIRQIELGPYLTTKQLMEMTGWSRRTIDNKRENDGLPYIKHGRRILFETEEVMSWLAEAKVEVGL